MRTAHLTPASAGGNGSEPWELMPEVLPSQIDLDFVEFITHLEDEFAEKRGEHHRFDQRERAILVGVTTGSVEEQREHLAELAELARFSDVVVLDTLVQRRSKLDRRYLIGKGKIEELVIQSLQKGADLIIFDEASRRPRCARSRRRPT